MGSRRKGRGKKSSNCCGLLHVEDGEGSTRDQYEKEEGKEEGRAKLKE